MKEYAKDIIIVVLTLIIACISVSYFFGFLKKEKQTEKEDIQINFAKECEKGHRRCRQFY